MKKISNDKQHNSYIDLHLHLDGALTLDMAKRLAGLQGISLPASDDEELRKLLTVPADCTSLNDFLKCFDLPLSLLQTEEGLFEAIQLAAEEQKRQGVIYAEIRYAPQLHTRRGMTQEEAVRAALSGLERVNEKGDIRCNLILCCMRGEGNDAGNLETLELARKYLVEDGGVTAIDLAGAEALFPTEKYAELFAKAKAYGIPFTIHAGEADGPESVRLAVSYGAKRIGHGVRIRENPEVVELVKKEGVTLEMCPTSNRQTHAVEDMEDYPLTDYLRQGLKITVNTDDPGIEGTTIGEEFRFLRKNFGLSGEEELRLKLNAVDAAFTTDQVKQLLRERLMS